MMRSSVAALIVLGILVAGCDGSPPENNTTSNIPEAQDERQGDTADATALADSLAIKGLPVSEVTTITEENDSNELLGRPNQYISKANFRDERYGVDELDEPIEHTIEVFANEADATARRQYVEEIGRSMPMFSQYIVQSGPVLLRLHKAMKPGDAQEYERALGEVVS